MIMAKQQTFCYTISEELKNEMVEYFKYKKRDKTPPYAIFQADEDGTVITLYESLKVVFQGISADIDASMWKQREKALTGKDVIENKKKEKNETKPDNTDYYFINSVGSDEVGTGDYFGPIVITASYVNKKDIPYLEELGVKDSKKLDDAKIIKIAKPIMDRIPHETIILSASEYNKIYNGGVTLAAKISTRGKVEDKFSDATLTRVNYSEIYGTYDNYIRLSGDKMKRIDLVLGIGGGVMSYHAEDETIWSITPAFKIGVDFEINKHITLSAETLIFTPYRNDYLVEGSYITGGAIKYVF